MYKMLAVDCSHICSDKVSTLYRFDPVIRSLDWLFSDPAGHLALLRPPGCHDVLHH
jgi:hypothetical protein